MKAEHGEENVQVKPHAYVHTRDEHGSGLYRTGSGLKTMLAGSGLDRTEKIFVVLMSLF